MRVLIFVNGHDDPAFDITPYFQADDYIIAVNGGTRYALQHGLTPHIIIGDMDSLSALDKERAIAGGVQMIAYSPRKDETDLELGLRHAIARGATEILLFAALGGHIDHSLANIFLLTLPELQDAHVQIIAGNQRLFIISDEARIVGNPGDTVSILPIGGNAVGVSNEGLEWPLYDETLPVGSPRGISNVLPGHEAFIRLRQGKLLCIVTVNSY